MTIARRELRRHATEERDAGKELAEQTSRG